MVPLAQDLRWRSLSPPGPSTASVEQRAEKVRARTAGQPQALERCLFTCYTFYVHDPLREIQKRIARGDYVLTVHFVEAMRDDGLFLADILSALDGATEAVEDGCDAQGDPKYRVRGDALDGRRIEVLCVLKKLVVLITVYVLRDLP